MAKKKKNTKPRFKAGQRVWIAIRYAGEFIYKESTVEYVRKNKVQLVDGPSFHAISGKKLGSMTLGYSLTLLSEEPEGFKKY